MIILYYGHSVGVNKIWVPGFSVLNGELEMFRSYKWLVIHSPAQQHEEHAKAEPFFPALIIVISIRINCI